MRPCVLADRERAGEDDRESRANAQGNERGDRVRMFRLRQRARRVETNAVLASC